jgi:leader peptidase (prepilin peptidase) / N-methyltransferase
MNLAAVAVAACIGALAGMAIPDAVRRFDGNPAPAEGGSSRPEPGNDLAHADDARERRVPRRPATALITAATWAGLTARIYPDPQLAAALVTALLAITAAFVDLRCLRLPNSIILPGTTICLTSVTATAIAQHQGPRLARTLAGTLAVALLWLLLSLLLGIGLGDAKTATWMSVLTGWTSIHTLVIATLGPALLHGAAALTLVASRRARLRDELPVGPAIIAAGLGALMLTGM